MTHCHTVPRLDGLASSTRNRPRIEFWSAHDEAEEKIRVDGEEKEEERRDR